jgi:hypothetical protein
VDNLIAQLCEVLSQRWKSEQVMNFERSCLALAYLFHRRRVQTVRHPLVALSEITKQRPDCLAVLLRAQQANSTELLCAIVLRLKILIRKGRCRRDLNCDHAAAGTLVTGVASIGELFVGTGELR